MLENSLVTEILVEDGAVGGVRVLDCQTGTGRPRIRLPVPDAGYRRRRSALFKFTTNSDVATGDGIALAYRAGAEITDMEFFQFHPTALRLPGVPPFLISEAVRGEGGVLRNASGHRFMPDYAPRSRPGAAGRRGAQHCL